MTKLWRSLHYDADRRESFLKRMNLLWTMILSLLGEGESLVVISALLVLMAGLAVALQLLLIMVGFPE